MLSRRTSTLSLMLITALLCLHGQALSDSALDCCLKTTNVRVPLQIVSSYYQQFTESGCPIPATVFITRKERKLCAPPAEQTDLLWVRRIISHLDRKKHSQP